MNSSIVDDTLLLLLLDAGMHKHKCFTRLTCYLRC